MQELNGSDSRCKWRKDADLLRKLKESESKERENEKRNHEEKKAIEENLQLRAQVEELTARNEEL